MPHYMDVIRQLEAMLSLESATSLDLVVDLTLERLPTAASSAEAGRLCAFVRQTEAMVRQQLAQLQQSLTGSKGKKRRRRRRPPTAASDGDANSLVTFDQPTVKFQDHHHDDEEEADRGTACQQFRLTARLSLFGGPSPPPVFDGVRLPFLISGAATPSSLSEASAVVAVKPGASCAAAVNLPVLLSGHCLPQVVATTSCRLSLELPRRRQQSREAAVSPAAAPVKLPCILHSLALSRLKLKAAGSAVSQSNGLSFGRRLTADLDEDPDLEQPPRKCPSLECD